MSGYPYCRCNYVCNGSIVLTGTWLMYRIHRKEVGGIQ